MNDKNTAYRKLPQVDKLLNTPEILNYSGLNEKTKAHLIREVLESYREKPKSVDSATQQDWVKAILNAFHSLQKKSLTHAINATGVILHTNLGRAPIGKSILLEMAEELSGYCTLEVDREKNKRGSRTEKVEKLICLLTEAEAALVVNNNAAALLLILKTLSDKKEVLISRGEIVQIGGGFRIHEILEEGGAKLIEVGTTNITKTKDYEKKITRETGCVLKVHQSNFTMSGHTESASIPLLKELCRKNKIPLVVDLGSGGMRTRPKGDPSTPSLIQKGVDLVCFSGDKLLGSSQAGIVVGSKKLIDKIRKSPLYRAFRLSKVDLFLLEETLFKHIRSEKTVTDGLIQLSKEEMKTCAEAFVKELGTRKIFSKIIEGTSSIGGGTTPQEELETVLVEIEVEDSEKAARSLSGFSPPIFVRKGKKKIFLDLRTVFQEEKEDLIRGIQCLF